MSPNHHGLAPADGVWQGLHIAAGSLADAGSAIEDAAIVVVDGHVRWVGARGELPPVGANLPRFDAKGALVTPGFIDCHTHLVYAGQRADEFAMRRAGASYEDIARAGGGILSTVAATRAADEDTLVSLAGKRLQPLLAEGLCAIEIKSGYGLTLADERKQLRVARRLGEVHGLTVKTTFLGAHALPPEYAGRADDYVDAVCREMLPALAAEKLVDAVDVFCERIAFTREQAERVFIAARELGIPVKLHAEQLSDMDGAALAAQYGALSCDHIEHLSAKGLAAMADAGTVAVLLPGAFYALRDTRCPPVVGLREAGVPMAVSTDHNPGTSPALSLLLMMNMACTLFGLTVPEALAGVTRHAARALGLQDSHGVIAAGGRANFVVWDLQSASELVYWIGQRPRCTTVRQGRIGHDGLGLRPSREETP